MSEQIRKHQGRFGLAIAITLSLMFLLAALSLVSNAPPAAADTVPTPIYVSGSSDRLFVTFFDADSVQQDAFDSLLTASMHIIVDVSGERDRPNWSGSVERHRDMWVTGLEGEETERTWNGTGDHSVLRSRHADTLPTRTYDMTGSSTIDDVVIPHPRTEDSWPLSGTITREVHVAVLKDGEVVREVDRTVVVVFDGTQYAEMTVNGEIFTIDLAERRLRRGYRHGQG